MPVRDLIVQRLGPTLLLMGTAIVLSVGIGILLGLVAARRPNSWRDNVISVFALVSYATPLFWVGLMFILLFSIHLGWLPTSGMDERRGVLYRLAESGRRGPPPDPAGDHAVALLPGPLRAPDALVDARAARDGLRDDRARRKA